MKLENKFNNLNAKLLKISNSEYDLSTVNGIYKTEISINGIADILNAPAAVTDAKFEAFIDDKTRTQIISLLTDLKDNPAALIKVEELLVREILYLGAECEELGLINIESEFQKLEALLNNKYLLLKRVAPPTISNLIAVWYEIKPKIFFISCHGDKFGLFLKDENNNCKHYTNIDFCKFFTLRSEHTECVVLSSCESLDLGILITDDGKNVVCINKKVDIVTASRYTHLFFEFINKYSLQNSEIYRNAHEYSIENIQFEGLEDSFSFEFLEKKKVN